MALFWRDRNKRFWKWFQEHDARVFRFEDERDVVFSELGAALADVHPDLTFELGPVRDGRREFVVSAGGIRSAFDAVQELVRAAPTSSRWQVVAFRPRRPSLCDITMGDLHVRAAEVSCRVESDGEKVGITLMIPGYRRTPDKLYEQIGYLLLDEALGEYTVETRIGFIEITVPDGDPSVMGLAELGAAVDAFRSK